MTTSGAILLGESLKIRQVRELIRRVAPSNLPVLIQGPTGSGKELVAHAIHALSGRRGNFVPFNVCAIADTMFEDTLFGHVRGAFTGAVHDAVGLLTQADRGTCFFDEISGLALSLQAKLLRAIESRKFRPVGARSDVASDFRIVAASNEDLGALKDAGSFREDLLHRFGKVVITVPSLRERAEDVPLLARHFLCEVGRPGLGIQKAAEQRLASYSWPGNVRELRSVIETAAVMSQGHLLTADDIAPLLRETDSGQVSIVRADFILRDTVAAVMEARGNVYEAAGTLGVNPTTVYRRLKRANLPLPLFLADGVAGGDPIKAQQDATERHMNDAIHGEVNA